MSDAKIVFFRFTRKHRSIFCDLHFYNMRARGSLIPPMNRNFPTLFSPFPLDMLNISRNFAAETNNKTIQI